MSSTISGNSTTGAFSDGGGVGGVLILLYDSTVSGNVTLGDWSRGGGVYAYYMYAYESTIDSNRTAGDYAEGGGARTYGGGVFSSTISGNATYGFMARGGGIRNYSPLDMRNSTVVNNHTHGAGSDGGGVSGWRLDVNDSIIANNSVHGLALGPDLSMLSLFVDFSLIGNNAGTGLSEAPPGMPDAQGNLIGDPNGMGAIDPRLSPLQMNGGPTATHIPLVGSPVRDAGNPNSIAGESGTPEFDQRGTPFERVVGGRIDMGAVEAEVDGDFNDDGLFDCLDIDRLVAEIASLNNNLLFDMTGDGIVDLADRDAWLSQAGEINLGPGRAYLLGDANLDGVVDGRDFVIWNINKFSSTPAWCNGDFNADGVVDGRDFVLWNAHKFQEA
jgi:hypothetical protein